MRIKIRTTFALAFILIKIRTQAREAREAREAKVAFFCSFVFILIRTFAFHCFSLASPSLSHFICLCLCPGSLRQNLPLRCDIEKQRSQLLVSSANEGLGFLFLFCLFVCFVCLFCFCLFLFCFVFVVLFCFFVLFLFVFVLFFCFCFVCFFGFCFLFFRSALCFSVRLFILIWMRIRKQGNRA